MFQMSEICNTIVNIPMETSRISYICPSKMPEVTAAEIIYGLLS